MTVFDLKKGDKAKVTAIKLDGGAAARLSALGLKNGTCIQILSFSLFKSAVLISFGAVRVGIRKSLAQKLEIALIEATVLQCKEVPLI